MLQRELEPEVMSEWEDADCYDQMDHSAVNSKFVTDFLAAAVLCRITPGPDVCDLGTGTALIPIELCSRTPDVRVMAIDASTSMLELAKYRIEVAGLRNRIQLSFGDVTKLGFADQFFDAIISNSIVHHLPNPSSFFATCRRLIKPGGFIFVRDLLRPSSADEVEPLVQLHTAGETPLAQQLFRQSLHASLTLQEVCQLLQEHHLDTTHVAATSDRHWTWFQRMS